MQNLTQSKKAKSQVGASMIEYALLVALIALIAYSGVNYLGVTIHDTFDEVTRQIPGEGQIEPPCNFAHPNFPNC